jgi:uncharacterized protein YndB with AHSA1/START domain
MSEYGKLIAGGAVQFERLLPGPIDRVWKYLTDSELRGTWLASGPMEQRAGGAATLHFQHANLTSHDETPPEKYRSMMEKGVTSVSTVVRCEPPRLLTITWDDDSEVTFELAAKGEQVLLTLTHRRLKTRGDVINVSGGWHSHLGILEERLRGEEPRPFWPRVEKFEREYSRRFADV